MTDPVFWNCERVGEFLVDNGFAEYKKKLCDEHRIDGRVLLSLKEQELFQLNITVLGDVKRILFAIQDLQTKHVQVDISRIPEQNGHIPNGDLKTDCQSSQSSESSNLLSFMESSDDERHVHKKRKIDQEKWKTGMSILYAFFVHFVTSFAIIIAQERMPDKKSYRPLPDILLDNIPYIPWAYKVTEGVILAGFITFFIILLFHKYRYVHAFFSRIHKSIQRFLTENVRRIKIRSLTPPFISDMPQHITKGRASHRSDNNQTGKMYKYNNTIFSFTIEHVCVVYT